MSITANTPPPKPSRDAGRGSLTWLFFLLIIARPLWGILRATLPPQLDDSVLWIIVAGLAGLGAVGALLLRVAGSSRAGQQPPTTMPVPQPVPQANKPSVGVPRRAPARGAYTPQPPRFEPIITGKVVLAGALLAAIMGGAGLLLWIGVVAR